MSMPSAMEFCRCRTAGWTAGWTPSTWGRLEGERLSQGHAGVVGLGNAKAHLMVPLAPDWPHAGRGDGFLFDVRKLFLDLKLFLCGVARQCELSLQRLGC